VQYRRGTGEVCSSVEEEIWSDGWQCGTIEERVIACGRQRESRSPARKISREQVTESANFRKRGGIAKNKQQ
jgi:hypothetical protein